MIFLEVIEKHLAYTASKTRPQTELVRDKGTAVSGVVLIAGSGSRRSCRILLNDVYYTCCEDGI